MDLKFRAWNGYRKIMADYVSSIQNDETLGTPSSVNAIVNGKNETWNIKNDNVKLLQFTGLKDIDDDAEIYDGDIISLDPDDHPYTVYFNEGNYEVYNGYIRYNLNEINTDCEIIGNVYEDQELLEGE